MALAAGSRLGPYEVLSLLGAGGMGEVWKARDTRLGRDVAVKVLPGDFLEDEERKVRFERERHHCSLVLTPAGVELRDLGSTNGTTLGGYRVSAAFVSHGAMIGVGSSLLSFEETDETLSEPLSQEPWFGPVLGQNQAMRRLFALAKRLAPSDATVLLEGETGTGKGLFAAAIHDASSRAAAPFVVVDCGALPPTLIESELFGHVRGTFTGAERDRVGLLEAAAGGSVLLDEVGDLPLHVQVKLLGFLDNYELRRLGDKEHKRVDVRILAATNRDLRALVDTGRFRQGLHLFQKWITRIEHVRTSPPNGTAYQYAAFLNLSICS